MLSSCASSYAHFKASFSDLIRGVDTAIGQQSKQLRIRGDEREMWRDKRLQKKLFFNKSRSPGSGRQSKHMPIDDVKRRRKINVVKKKEPFNDNLS